jgi:hypothetical protein
MAKERRNLSTIQVLSAATATNSPPSGAGAGFALPGNWDECRFMLRSTAGSATMTVTIRAWGWDGGDVDYWFPLGTHPTDDALKGVLNEGTAIDENRSDKLEHTELLSGLRGVRRIYFEITAIGGTNTAVSAWIKRTRRAVV